MFNTPAEKHITLITHSSTNKFIRCSPICDSLFMVLIVQACVHFNDGDETPPQTCSVLSVSPLIGFLSSVSRALSCCI